MASHIGRRKFLATLGAAAAAWPLAAGAQQADRVRRIGVLLPAAPDDAEFQSWVGAFFAGARAIRPDHLTQHTDRNSMDQIRRRRDSQIRGRIDGTRTGRHRGNGQLNRGTLVTPDPHGADRVSAGAFGRWPPDVTALIPQVFPRPSSGLVRLHPESLRLARLALTSPHARKIPGTA
jgi:hypothetical protein